MPVIGSWKASTLIRRVGLGFILALGLHAQAPATRNVSLTWVPSVTPNVTGVNVYRCTMPCTLATGGIPLNGITPILVPMQGYIDTTAQIGSIYTYGVTAVAPACTAATPPTTACGESVMSITVTVAIGPKPAAPAGAPAVVVQ